MKFQYHLKIQRTSKDFYSPVLHKMKKQDNICKKYIKTNIFKLFLWAISIGMFCPTAVFAQQNLIGTWELIGRICENDSTLIPLEDSIQQMIFKSGGAFQGTYYSLPYAGEMTPEEFREYKISRARERQDVDEENHERECQRQDGQIFDEGGEVNICERRGKEKLYEKWWNSRMREIEDELEEDGVEDLENPVCEMVSDGRWTASGNSLTVRETSLSAAPACGLEDSGQARRSLSGKYYFENGDLYFTLQANEHSREFCGSSDWSAIFLKK